MLAENLKKLIKMWTREHLQVQIEHPAKAGEDIWPINSADLDHLAHYLAQKLEVERNLRKKMSNIELVRSSLRRQEEDLLKEQEEIRCTCPHLFGTQAIATEDGENVEYICETCGSEVIL